MRFRIAAAVIGLTGLLSGLLAPAATGITPTRATAAGKEQIRPVRDCRGLIRIYDIPGASTRVTSADPIDATGGDPAHCDVQGVIAPAVQFRLKLPTETYSGRYLQHGCGGFCGYLPPPPFPDCPGRPNGDAGHDFAIAATDDGHPTPGFDARWAENNQAARDDWFYRAPHVLSLAAKRIIASYYGAPPKRSYFDSCSNGGREAMLLAQRYPHDFDGIIAAAPAAYMGPLFGMYFAWMAKATTAADGSSILPTAKLGTLHDAVVAACDRLDGLVDGQIDDPRACRYDPIRLQCPTGVDQPHCLTPTQVTAARKAYAGPTDRNGRRLYPGWQTRGSEPAWDPWINPNQFGGPFMAGFADNYRKYVGYPIGTPHSSLAGAEFTARDLHRLTPEGVRGNALSPDLREFRRSGGKLIIWHGWDDEAVPAIGTLDYYQRLWQHNGGLRATQRWARLFMIPTMYHCGGGYRLNEFSALPHLVDWVEDGDAPDRIVANQRDAGSQTVVRTRPVFPYPLRARYDGTGSIDDAGNFVPAHPPSPPRDTIDWVGAYLHALPGPVAR